jgi:hypothetical protein
MILIHILTFCIGLYCVGFTVNSAIRTFVLPRADNTRLTYWTFKTVWKIYRLRLRSNYEYHERHRLLALFTPLTLALLPTIWIAIVVFGYGLMFWSIGVSDVFQAFSLSGSSALTLGFTPVDNLPQTILAFSEAAIGVGLIALSIAYLPTMYTAFSRREALVSKMSLRFGTPPSGVGLIMRMQNVNRLDLFEDMWQRFEDWFVDMEETHTSLAPLNFFRSSQPYQSWLTTAGTILDGTALFLAAIDFPATAQAPICMRAGYIALRHIGDFFGIQYELKPTFNDPISISRAQFDHALTQLQASNVPLKSDHDQAWRDFRGWRVNYDTVLRELVKVIGVPPAPWINDMD